ncbi:hypothetical protein FH972_024224 [Carpinus fangiana]|uniref:C2H2-type domain-containing protein n=1 Tax=Carpinus fangiana TaxID=176857 RepID=A0A5N6KXY0_9ROSI|nr:hypothetical protein FH972_024224 [Carpinus fangiana]
MFHVSARSMASTQLQQLHSDSLRPILLASRQCAKAFVQTEKELLDPTATTRLRNERRRFAIWCGSLGVFADGHASADHRLRNEKNTTYILVMLLKRLERKTRALFEPPHDLAKDSAGRAEDSTTSTTESDTSSSAESDSAVSSFPDDFVSAKLREISNTVTRLYRWSTVIKKPVSTNEIARVENFMQKEVAAFSTELAELQLFARWKIKRMYPGLDYHMLDRLTSSIVFRRKRIIYRRHHREKLNYGVREAFYIPDDYEANPEMDMAFENMDQQRDRLPTFKQRRPGPKSATEATSIDGRRLSSYARSRADSKLTRNAKDRQWQYDVPKAPILEPGEEETICPYCSGAVDRKCLQQPQWTHHVLKDLQPYICIFEGCERPKTQFRLESEWVHHMQWEHNVAWFCPQCHRPMSSPGLLEAHVRQNHAKHITEVETSRLLQNCARPINDLFLPSDYEKEEASNVCPFCTFSIVQAKELVFNPVPRTPEDSGPLIAREIQRHIAQHLEELSLLSLPEQSDASSVDDGIDTAVSSTQYNEDIRSLPLPDFEDNLRFDAQALETGSDEHLPATNKETWYNYYTWRTSHVPAYIHPDDDPLLENLARKGVEKTNAPRKNYYVALLCSSACITVLKALLDELHNPVSEELTRYAEIALGNMSGHNVVLACARIELQTIYPLASELANHYSELKVYISVGVGGGAPSPTKDIRLGDVVVSQWTKGLVKYYINNLEDNRSEAFKYGVLEDVPLPLALAVAKLQDNHRKESNSFQSILDGMFQNRPSMFDAFSRPSTSDVLYNSDYNHAVDTPNCDYCDEQKMVIRGARVHDAMVHHGSIGTSLQLPESGQIRDTLSDAFDLLCFDTNAVEVPDSFPCIFIRGICDYADTHHKESKFRWERYASANAAACAKELLKFMRSPLEESKAMDQKILNWLSGPDFSYKGSRDRVTLPMQLDQVFSPAAMPTFETVSSILKNEELRDKAGIGFELDHILDAEYLSDSENQQLDPAEQDPGQSTSGSRTGDDVRKNSRDWMITKDIEDMLSTPMDRKAGVLCIFRFSACEHETDNFETWFRHSATHFGHLHIQPPRKLDCCGCPNLHFESQNPDRWFQFMRHMWTQHINTDSEYSTFGERKTDQAFLSYMWQQRVINDSDFKLLMKNPLDPIGVLKSEPVTDTGSSRDRRRV